MPTLTRLYRLLVIIGIAWFIKAEPPRKTAPPFTEFFPEATSYSPETHEVANTDGKLIGFLLTTLPETEHIRGYSGPCDIAIALNPSGQLLDARILSSPDTEDHLASVKKDGSFWEKHRGLKLGAPGNPEIDAVSGSTLTSVAISRSIIERLGGETTSQLFPTDILLAEFAALLPEAQSLDNHPTWPSTKRLYNSEKKLIGHALRTAPSLEYLKGFQGPTDVLILLDAEAHKVTGLRFRKSYDNEDYYERILDDSDYLQLYNGKTITEIIMLEKEIEGISGATDTSWAIAEGVKRRLAQFDSDRNPTPFKFPWRNVTLIALTLGAFLFSFTKLRGNPFLRLAWQIFVVIALGFLLGDLLSQALFIGWAKHGLPFADSWGLIFLAGAAFLVPWASGNQLYCHQLCPHGFLQQWLGKLCSKRITLPKIAQTLLSYLPSVLLVLIAILAIVNAGINYADFEGFDAWLWRSAGIATIAIAIIGLFASLVIPMAYCKFGCPTGALFKFLRFSSAGKKIGLRDIIAGALFILAIFYFA